MDSTERRTKHTQITDYFSERIERGELQAGERIPTYAELAAQFEVSVATVRQAMNALRHNGLVDSLGGAGSFVSDRTGVQSLGWKSIHNITQRLHDEIETSYTPEVVLTMSGPGGFAAMLSMSYSMRLVPTLVAVTFPLRESVSAAENSYRQAAKSSTWKRLETGKWSVYLPKALANYPESTRVLIFDDRVLSGTTQKLARDHLESAGMNVKTAALVVSTDNTMNVDYFGTIIDDRFSMPWGTDRGRT